MPTGVSIETFAVGSTRHFGALVGLPIRGLTPFPALVALIRHPRVGPILFDAGYGAGMVHGGGMAMRLYRAMLPVRLPPLQRLDRRLAERGVAPQDLALVVLSHAHPDHIGGLSDLPVPRPLLWSRTAADSFSRGTPASRFREATLDALRPPAAWADQRFVEDLPRLNLAGALPGFETGFDLLRDSSLVAVPLPGHARGQYGLLCKLGSGGLAFLVADAAWHTAAITEGVDPSPVLDRIAQDPKAYHRTLAALRGLHAARPCEACTRRGQTSHSCRLIATGPLVPRLLDLVRTATAYLRARRHQRLPPPAIAHLQRRGLLAHPGLARRLSAGADRGEPLQTLLDRLPLSDPSSLRQNFPQLNRLGLSLGEARARAEAEKNKLGRADGYSFGLSTGSEGEPSVFITSPAERAAYVGTVLGRVLAPGELAGRRAALLLKHDNTLYGGGGRSRLFALSYFDIAAPLHSWIVRLIAESPDIVIGPPSVLLAASEHPAFAARPLHPRVLLTGAEPTFPSDARRLEAVYGIAPRPIYQACEGFVAVACRFGTLHINEDALAAEWRRFRCDTGRAAPAITDFTRITQDVWRVLLHDIVELGRGACPCGSTLRGLAGVEGRFSDVLYTAERRDGGPGLLFPFALDAMIEDATPHDCEWRIEQERRDSLSVATARELTARERARLHDALAAAGGWPHLRWESLQPRPTAVKRRRFIRRIDPMSEAVLQALGPPYL